MPHKRAGSSRPDNPEATRLPAKVRNIVNFNEKNMPQIFGVAFGYVIVNFLFFCRICFRFKAQRFQELK